MLPLKNCFGKYFLKNIFDPMRNVLSPLKPKLKQILEGDEAQPNKLSLYNLRNMLTTKKKLLA